MSDAFGRPRRIAVLGGGSDIGTAIVRALIARGGVSSVVLAGPRPEVYELEAEGVDVDTVSFDALDPATHAPAIEAMFAGADDVDLFIVAAGLLGEQEAAERDPEAAGRMATVNYAGLVPALTEASARLIRQGHGAIVVLSSVAAQRPRRSNYVYGAAKAGFDAFARGLQLRLFGSGVHLLLVRPGFVKTKMTAGIHPLPLATTADAVAAAVVRGLDARSETVWVPGVFRYVMWLIRILPSAAVRRL